MNVADPLDAGDVARLNDQLRGLRISLQDKRDLADTLGVSVREVERWTTTAGQTRNAIPRAVIGQTWEDLPQNLQERILLASALSNSRFTRDDPDVGRKRVFRLRLQDSLGNVLAKVIDELVHTNPFIAQQWRYVSVHRTVGVGVKWTADIGFIDPFNSPAGPSFDLTDEGYRES